MTRHRWEDSGQLLLGAGTRWLCRRCGLFCDRLAEGPPGDGGRMWYSWRPGRYVSLSCDEALAGAVLSS